MRLVTYAHRGGERLGALVGGDQVLDLAAVDAGVAFASMQALIDAGAPGLEAAAEALDRRPAHALRPLAEVRLRAPLPRPTRIRDCSLFLEHMEKALAAWAQRLAEVEPDPKAALADLIASGRFSLKPIFKSQVIYYNADHMALSGPDDEIAFPPGAEWMDYELEFACVVGKAGRDVARADAARHIFGYTIFNDWSARDLQKTFMQTGAGPGAGKDFPGGNGFGPCIVTPDEVGDPYALTMAARVNGEEWSRGSTASMHHRFEDAIVQFANGRDLLAGDIIGSGTVLSGCGFELNRKLAPGDVVELEIERIGVLRHRVVRA